jgi:hypothetical protein
MPVFMDTRWELYDEKLWSDYTAVSQGKWDWELILGQYGVDTILVGKAKLLGQNDLIDAARASNNWLLLQEDDVAVVFRKKGP